MLLTFLFAFAAALAEFLGGFLIAAKRSWPRKAQEFLLALGAGFLLALVFLELIPKSLETLGETAALYVMIGFAVIHFFEHAIVGHLHFGEETHPELIVSKAASFSAFSGLFVHSFFDGFTISAGLQFEFSLGLLVFLAVLLHKFPEGLTIGSIMLTAGYPKRTILAAATGIAGATILGAFSALALSSGGRQIVGMALAFSAGAAAYVGASDLIPEINKSENRIPPLVVFVGMLLFYLTDRWLESLLG